MGREILNARQVTFIQTIQKSPDLTDQVYLTGGTALAAFYLNHRESEDLDFFSEEVINPLAIEVFLKSHKSDIGYETFEFQRSFNRNLFFLHFRGEVLKIEFTFFPFTPLEAGQKEGMLRIDSLRDIAVNKVFTISQQTRARDFVDLYFILQREKWVLRELLKDARIKFDTPIDLLQFGSQLIKVVDLKDMPRMKAPLDEKQLYSFFLQEAASFKNDILS